MKFCILRDVSELKDIIDFLVFNFGLPSIQNRLNIYSIDNKFQLQFINNKIFYKDSTNGKVLILKNKNLKTLFNFANNQCQSGFRINDILLFEFKNAQILFNTFHGNVLYIEETWLNILLSKGYKIDVYNKAMDHELVFSTDPENLFDEIGALNAKIRSYAHKVGLDIRSASSSIRLRLSNLSNDYSYPKLPNLTK